MFSIKALGRYLGRDLTSLGNYFYYGSLDDRLDIVIVSRSPLPVQKIMRLCVIDSRRLSFHKIHMNHMMTGRFVTHEDYSKSCLFKMYDDILIHSNVYNVYVVV